MPLFLPLWRGEAVDGDARAGLCLVACPLLRPDLDAGSVALDDGDDDDLLCLGEGVGETTGAMCRSAPSGTARSGGHDWAVNPRPCMAAACARAARVTSTRGGQRAGGEARRVASAEK